MLIGRYVIERHASITSAHARMIYTPPLSRLINVSADVIVTGPSPWLRAAPAAAAAVNDCSYCRRSLGQLAVID